VKRIEWEDAYKSSDTLKSVCSKYDSLFNIACQPALEYVTSYQQVVVVPARQHRQSQLTHISVKKVILYLLFTISNSMCSILQWYNILIVNSVWDNTDHRSQTIQCSPWQRTRMMDNTTQYTIDWLNETIQYSPWQRTRIKHNITKYNTDCLNETIQCSPW